MDDKVIEYAKRKIEQIELIQKDELLNSLTRMNATLSLGTAINLLQELIGVYESVLKGKRKK